ncbi:hypothetical protein ACFY0A_24360 [Streptomyces sp. NPDC001698]|uniref:hypothetical protein n=1 Tax=unclassified Streptomyces TaxID=2593676 RepID=UPI00369B8FB2
MVREAAGCSLLKEWATAGRLVLAFLAAVAASAVPSRPATTRLARSSDPIDLTVPEVQHLFEW